MDRIDELRVLIAVADLRGFAQAARRLGISPAQASKLIARLEDRLDTRLLNRTTRDVSLTDAGRAFQARARVLVEEFEQLERSAQETAAPSGLLKLTAPVSFGAQLGSLLLDFARAYPNVGLEVSFSDRIVNLVNEGFDAAVRIGMLPDSSLVARKLSTVRAVTIASPDYLDARGTPRTPGELPHHDVIIDSNRIDPEVWVFGRGAKRTELRVSGRLRFANPYMCVAAARAGFGIACEPAFAAAEDLRNGRLVPLLKKYEPEPVAVYAVYPHARHLASKVRIFIDFLASRFASEPEWHQGWD
jgi:DNA-binding transcriptional LysR family regulator